ncbi:hypothetical protein C8F01DRAFT_275194 [Mycena amicta]|nr:hypothetical protein C8F01DRAFT_275194 [Mycena amicta]
MDAAEDSSPASPDSTEGALPQELIDHIVSLVDDTRTLKLCALAGSVLRATSQRRLFAELTIMPSSISSAEENPPLTPTNLLEMLLHSPHIQTYIRSLTLRLSDDSPYRAVWINDPLLPSILGKFDNLTSLTVAKIIIGATNPIPRLYWAMFPPTFKQAVEGLLAVPSLETLRLQQLLFVHTEELLGLVRQAPSLKELQFSCVSAEDIAHHAGPSPALELSVSRLSVDWLTRDLVHALTRIVKPDHLRYIHADAEGDNLQQLLGTVGKRLEHLHVQCTHYRPLDACPDIRNLSNLQTLELTLVLPSQYLPNHVVSTTSTHYEMWLLRMMQIVSRANERLGIRRIIINIQLQTPYEADFSFVSRLQPLDLLFMQSFPVLQELVVRLGIGPDARFHDTPAIGANARWRMRGEVEVRAAFTVLNEKGMVTVEVL